MVSERFFLRSLWLSLALCASVAQADTAWPQASARVTEDKALLADDGRTLVPAGRYESIRPAGQVAIVRRAGWSGLIDRQGQPVTPLVYRHIQRVNDDDDRAHPQAFVVQAQPDPAQPALTGVLAADGSPLIEPEWFSIDVLSVPHPAEPRRTELFFKVSREQRHGVIGPDGRLIHPVRYREIEGPLDGQRLLILSGDEGSALCALDRAECPVPMAAQTLERLDRLGYHDDLLLQRRPDGDALIDLRGRSLLPAGLSGLEVLAGGRGGRLVLAARQGFQRPQFELLRGSDGAWQVRPPSPLLPASLGRDQHPEALRQKAVIEARYLPADLRSVEAAEQALASGRLRRAQWPSVQLSAQQGFVTFGALASHAPGQPWPDTLVRCALPEGGFRLVAPAGERDTPAVACRDTTARALRWRPAGPGEMQCDDCAAQGLPERWVRADETSAVSTLCPAPAALSPEAAQQAYEAWGRGWVEPWRIVFRQGLDALPQGTNLDRHVAPRSRGFGTLAAIYRSSASVVQELGMDPSKTPKISLGEALLKWLPTARPVRSGGLYPESEAGNVALCAEVWYLQWPALDRRMAQRPPGAVPPPLPALVLPPEGTLVRQAYPFVLMERSPTGWRLAGLSRELIQMVWWLEGGR